jgi:hypothetical protein
MTDKEYKDLVGQVNSGALLVGVDRAVARRFYTDVSLSRIEEETGEAPYLEKMVIWLAYLTSPISLLASVVLSILAFSWWAVLAIPASVGIYLFWAGQSSMPQRGMLVVSILLAVAIGSLFMPFFTSPFICWYLIAMVYALWSSRLTYCAATTSLLGFVLRNQRAFEYMAEDIRVKLADR